MDYSLPLSSVIICHCRRYLYSIILYIVLFYIYNSALDESSYNLCFSLTGQFPVYVLNITLNLGSCIYIYLGLCNLRWQDLQKIASLSVRCLIFIWVLYHGCQVGTIPPPHIKAFFLIPVQGKMGGRSLDIYVTTNIIKGLLK